MLYVLETHDHTSIHMYFGHHKAIVIFDIRQIDMLNVICMVVLTQEL